MKQSSIKEITRDEYRKMLKDGIRFRGAYLYEGLHNPNAVFYKVKLSNELTVIKRKIG